MKVDIELNKYGNPILMMYVNSDGGILEQQVLDLFVKNTIKSGIDVTDIQWKNDKDTVKSFVIELGQRKRER